MGFFNEIGKAFKKVGNVVKKVATPVLGIVGGAVGGPIGASVGGALGGLIGNTKQSNVPEISDSYSGINPNVGNMGLYHTTGINGNVVIRQDGTVDFGSGTVVPPYINGSSVNYLKENGKVFGNSEYSIDSNSNNSAAPLLLGVGALMLLSD